MKSSGGSVQVAVTLVEVTAFTANPLGGFDGAGILTKQEMWRSLIYTLTTCKSTNKTVNQQKSLNCSFWVVSHFFYIYIPTVYSNMPKIFAEEVETSIALMKQLQVQQNKLHVKF